MKILMLHNRYLNPGGEDQSTSAEVRLLNDHGCEVELLQEDNRAIEGLGKLRTAGRSIWSRQSYQRVHDKLRDGRFDILHVQNFFPLWSPSVYYAAARCGVAVVQTLRNFRLVCVNAMLFRDGHVCEECLGRKFPWPGIVHRCYRDSRAASATVGTMIGLHKLAGTWQDKVQVFIALTELAREKLAAGGLPLQKIVVKPNFVYPTPPPGDGCGKFALFVGRLSAEKGVGTMLRAWQSAEDPLPLKIVGEGPLTQAVREAAATTPRIQCLGPKSPEETFALMQQARLLIFPSECYEGMPRTVMESLAAGTPVLASNIGGGGGMVKAGETGFHFQPCSSQELTRLVEWCSRNPEKVDILRANARAAFEQHYTGEANVKMLLDIYRRARQPLPSAAGFA